MENLLKLKFLDYIDKDEFLKKFEKGYFEDVSGIIYLSAYSDTAVKDLLNKITGLKYFNVFGERKFYVEILFSKINF